MKKLVKLALIIAAVMCIASCGRKSEETEEPQEDPEISLTPETTTIKGPLGEYFSVVDRTFTIKNDGYFTILAVEVEHNDNMTPFLAEDICFFPNGNKSDASMLGGFGYELIDEKGDVIDKGSASSSSTVYSWDDVEEALRSIPGERTTIRFNIYDLNGTPKTFRITSDLQKNKKSKSSVEADDYDTTDIADDTDDIEEAVNDIKKTAEKSVNGVKKAIEAEKAALDLINSLYN